MGGGTLLGGGVGGGGEAVPEAEGGQLGVRRGAVLLGVVREDSGAVEGAVVLGEVQPALQAVRGGQQGGQQRKITAARSSIAKIGRYEYKIIKYATYSTPYTT
eukprot:750995-Prorocentrum_minimum.AAC.3